MPTGSLTRESGPLAGFFLSLMYETHGSVMDGGRLNGRKIILGVTGGIAAYKAAELLRLFRKAGAEVQVLMTRDAARFITPLTLGTLSEREVLTEIFPDNADGTWTRHIELGMWADLFVIAPLTAQTLARLAHGFCDSMLTAVALAARCPVLACPAMDHDMYLNPSTRRNLGLLTEYGYHLMEPGYGELASGLIGTGRLPEPSEILERAASIIEHHGSMTGRRVVVTAGPTQEAIDPVRFISNGSTGTMGFELAAAAARRGATVTLVSGPTLLETPPAVQRRNVISARQMLDVVLEHRDADVFIMAAAVSDYAPAETSPLKRKKGEGSETITFERTPDILETIGRERRPDQLLVGFALETHDGLSNARKKLERKGLDWIVLNEIGEPGVGFGTGTNRVSVCGRDGSVLEIGLSPKRQVAETILDLVISQGK
jgi:phosphopantothenoylcysteine decarboxylase / phosphopantothenate---cysteine ligase